MKVVIAHNTGKWPMKAPKKKRINRADRAALAVARELQRNWIHLYQAGGGEAEFPAWSTDRLAAHFRPCIAAALRVKR